MGREGCVNPDGCPFSIGDPGRAAVELRDGPPGLPIGHPDVELTAASLPGMVIRAATVRGLHHRFTGEPRQDSYALSHRRDPDGLECVIAVVCDGVGSLKRSHEASRLVSRCLAALGAEDVPWPAAFADTNDRLRVVAGEARALGNGDPMTDGMATTAVAVALRREADDWVGNVAWVGDSPVWHLSPKRAWTLVAGPTDSGNGEYYTTTATSLPSTEGACTSRDFRLSKGSLFIMSDGVGNPLKWSHDVQDALAEWWAEPSDPFTFGAEVGFSRKAHMDDRTVVGIWADTAGPTPGGEYCDGDG